MTTALHDTSRSSYDLWKFLVQQDCIWGHKKGAPPYETNESETTTRSTGPVADTGGDCGVELIGLDD